MHWQAPWTPRKRLHAVIDLVPVRLHFPLNSYAQHNPYVALLPRPLELLA